MKQLLSIMLLTLCVCAGLHAVPSGKTVLGLYKSSEGKSAGNNEIKTYLSGIIRDLGLRLTYWDIDKNIPRQKDLENVRAIITWFDGNEMKDPKSYLEFLNLCLDAGKKLVIIGNFGAYYNSTDKEYTATPLINYTMARLGIIYLGEWTDNPGLYVIKYKDPKLCEYKAKQNAALSAFFLQFLPVDKNLNVYLSLKRTDKDLAPSPVIVTNKNGGFAMSGYLFRSDDNERLPLLNFREFLIRALFPRPRTQKILLLVDESMQSTRKLSAYTQAVLKRAKIPFEVLNRNKFTDLCAHDLFCYTSIGLILTDDAGLSSGLFTNYLYQGGGLVSFMAGNFDELRSVLLMGPQKAKETWNHGYHIQSGLALGEDLALEDSEYDWDSGTHPPTSGATILGTDESGKTPLVWTNMFHKGRVLVWNWNAMAGGNFQGLILESFLYVQPLAACVTAGLGVLFIDDWPLPMYNNIVPPLKITTTEFYTTRWWPQIKELLSRYAIPVNAFLVFNYNDITTPPFLNNEFYLAKGNASAKAAGEILAMGGELGLHGYNHVSLTREKTDYNPKAWSSTKDMALSLRQAKRTWTMQFGAETLPFAYVAPQDIISDEGIRTLHEVFPSIKTVSTVRTGGKEETSTEFGPSPIVPGIYYIPRVSSGYLFTPYIRQIISSSVAGPGIWTHFIHPDDLFDPSRSKGKSWEELYSGLENMFAFVKKHYPWLRFVKIREAYKVLQALDQAPVTIEPRGKTLHIQAPPGIYIRIRTNQYELEDADQAKIIYQYKHMPVIIILTTKSVHDIRFK